jgi:hypothetical protein
LRDHHRFRRDGGNLHCAGRKLVRYIDAKALNNISKAVFTDGQHRRVRLEQGKPTGGRMKIPKLNKQAILSGIRSFLLKTGD